MLHQLGQLMIFMSLPIISDMNQGFRRSPEATKPVRHIFRALASALPALSRSSELLICGCSPIFQGSQDRCRENLGRLLRWFPRSIKNLFMPLFLTGWAVFQWIFKRKNGPLERNRGNAPLRSENGPLRTGNGPLRPWCWLAFRSAA